MKKEKIDLIKSSHILEINSLYKEINELKKEKYYLDGKCQVYKEVIELLINKKREEGFLNKISR